MRLLLGEEDSDADSGAGAGASADVAWGWWGRDGEVEMSRWEAVEVGGGVDVIAFIVGEGCLVTGRGGTITQVGLLWSLNPLCRETTMGIGRYEQHGRTTSKKSWSGASALQMQRGAERG